MNPPLHLAIGAWLWTPRPDGACLRLTELARHAADRLLPGERLTWLAGEAGAPELPERVAVHQVAVRAQPPRARAADQARVLPSTVRALGINRLEAPCLPLPDLRDAGCEVWTIVHDLRDLHGLRRRSSRLLRPIYRRALARADGILVPSHATAAELQRFGLGRARAVVPNGVRPIAIPRAPDRHGRTVLHVGHLERRKNLGVLVEAAAHLQRRGIAFRLVLAGADAGAGRALARQVRRLGLGDVVSLPGIVDEPTKHELFRTCSAVAVPSRCEGFGIVALEALAWGAPTLIADTPALVEVAGGAATVLPADDPRSWADALAAILMGPRDADAARAAEAERRARAATFGWPDAARRWLEAFRVD